MRVALIGLGMVSDTHVAALRDSKDVTLHGVLARRPKHTQSYAKRIDPWFPRGVRAYASADEIANDPHVDFVILATPPNARAEIVETLITAGKPILMEKPIERTWAAAQKIVDACNTFNVPLGIVLQHRAREASRVLKRAIDSGELGQLVSAEIRVPWWRDQSYYDAPGRGSYARDGGGVMISQAIHTLDLAMWLMGEFRYVQALMHRSALHDLEAEDWAGALFQTESGAVGTLFATTAAFPGEAESITLQGTRATAHLCKGVLTTTTINGYTQTYGEASETGSGADPMAFTHAWHQSVIEDFAQSLIDKRDPLATGQSALGAQAVIHAMTQASNSGKRTKVPTT